MSKKIIILGAGACGLSAAYRLKQLGVDEYLIFEKSCSIGGLCSSIRDDHGFSWDLGGHVFFSDKQNVNNFLNDINSSNWVCHIRNSYIYMLNRFIPYPFQHNLRYLPEHILIKCLMDFIENRSFSPIKNFHSWLINSFGYEISNQFMIPYNQKLWQTDLTKMGYLWTKGYVSSISMQQLLKHIITQTDSTTWGKNLKFKYPASGGIQTPFKHFGKTIKNKIKLQKEAVKIDAIDRTIFFSDNSCVKYDYLINTTPLDDFVPMLNSNFSNIKPFAQDLKHNSVLILGIGINGSSQKKGSWIYFPEKEAPLYRVTFLSQYATDITPDNNIFSSYMAEIPLLNDTQQHIEMLTKETVTCLHQAGLFDKNQITHLFTKTIPKAYPIPTLNRDNTLNVIQNTLEQLNIFSRGWLGSWKYESANIENSILQGFEVIDKILFLKPENTINN